jgi:hypothetical protein
VLADLDSEVVFAHRYVQQFNAQKLAALRRFPWTVSHAQHRLAQTTTPRSDAERFWKHVYCRTATWGAKPTCRGFSSIHEGDTYPLDELWKFKQRLRHTRIVRQDWKRTLSQSAGLSQALFFIDPPYIEEWSIAEGIAPEDIAEQVASLKGKYLIAYTDSARARRAFAHSGHQFKLRIMETRRRGVFAKSSRLFVRSWDDDGWLKPQEVYQSLLRILDADRRRL